MESASERLTSADFDALAARWRRFVESLDGYGFSIYDYDNDVDVRQRLQEAAAQQPVDIQVQVWSGLRALDEAFIQGTRFVHRSRYPETAWHSRIPLNPGDEMREDIEGGNL